MKVLQIRKHSITILYPVIIPGILIPRERKKREERKEQPGGMVLLKAFRERKLWKLKKLKK